jgi:hypothetical protein
MNYVHIRILKRTHEVTGPLIRAITLEHGPVLCNMYVYARTATTDTVHFNICSTGYRPLSITML